MALFKRRKKVLVLDDEAGILSFVKDLLVAAKYDAVAFDNPLAALERLSAGGESARFDLLVLDIRMPNLNGYEFLARSRKMGLGDVPVVMLTALGNAEDMAKGYEKGADYYLTKPFDSDKFMKVVRYFIGDLSEEERKQLGAEL